MKIEFVSDSVELSSIAVNARIVFEDEPLRWPPKLVGAGCRFTGERGQTLEFLVQLGDKATRLMIVGGGKREAFDASAAEHTAATAYAAAKLSGAAVLRLEIPIDEAIMAARAALGVRLASYRFDKYRTNEAVEKKPSIVKTVVVTADPVAALAAFAPLEALAEAITFSRDLVSEPANILYPAEFARRAKELEKLGLVVEIIGELEMAEFGMDSLLAVGQGSARESQLVVMRWSGAPDKNSQPLAFIGKGVCFDSGGISIKPSEGMEAMKWDMGGAGAVAGLLHVLAGRKARVNAVGILGLVENMPDGSSLRPGDVIKSMSGQTIEVINTDAEGRLVLADAVWYCQDRFKPKFMIDVATLTGSIITSLGNDYAGLFSNNDELASALLIASSEEGELVWRMPLPEHYDKQINSEIADMKNLGERAGGSITAALFIQRFVNGLPWAHLDIASTAWAKRSTVPTIPEGATGFGVRLLNRMVEDKYEER